jgi:hypothetical protein
MRRPCVNLPDKEMSKKLPIPMTQFDFIGLEDDWCHMNGEPISDEKRENDIKHFVFNEFQQIEVCPYCSQQLPSFTHHTLEKMNDYGHYSNLWSCSNCSYWQCYFSGYSELPLTSFSSWYAFISKVRTFDDGVPEPCSVELAQVLRRQHKSWHTVAPRKLELLVADVFKAKYSHCEVMHVGRPGDGGVDVVFIDAEKQQWLIQVKRRENPLSSEGVTTVRNLLGTMVVEGTLRGIVVSTADHFTVRAYDAVRRAKENHSLEVQLIDRGKLNRMLSPLLPKKPWLRALKDEVPAYILRIFSRKFSERLGLPKRQRDSSQLMLWKEIE